MHLHWYIISAIYLHTYYDSAEKIIYVFNAHSLLNNNIIVTSIAPVSKEIC